MKKTLLLIAMIVSSLTSFADDVTVAPVLDVNYRVNADGTAWQAVKDAAEEGNTDFELTYAAGFFSLQKYTVADLQKATKLVITLTVGSKNGVDAIDAWSIAKNDWDATTGVDDLVPLVTAQTGVALRSNEGTANTPLAKGAKVTGSDPAKATLTISGAALATVKANATEDGTFTIVLTNNQYTNANSKRSYLSNNTANDEANRPTMVATIETPSVMNTTTGVGYSTLTEAFAAAVAAETDAVLEVSGDQTLTDRLTLNKAISISIIPTKDITIKGQKNKMWFLANINGATLIVGSKDHKITLDGRGDDRSSFTNVDVARRENNTHLYLTNIEFKDFTCGANHLVGCKNNGGAIHLEDIAFTNCSSDDALISNLREQNDALLLKGFLNQDGCTGTTIYTAKNRIRLGDPENTTIYDEFTTNSDITIAWGGEVAEGTNVIVKVPGSAAYRFKLVGQDGWWLARKASNGDMYMTQTDPEPTDGITTVQGSGVKANNTAIYNLAGHKVGENYKGIVIKNGKKTVNK